MAGGIRSASRLLDPLDDLHFAKVAVSCLSGDFGSTTEPVPEYSVTLESLTIVNWVVGAFPSISVIGRYLTVAHRRRHV